MSAAKQAVWLSSALIALACSGYYFAIPTTTVRLDAQTLSTTPDAIITDLNVRQFDAQGQLSNHMYAKEMRHIPQGNTHLFKKPHIIVAQAKQANWDIRAAQARAINGGEQITFLQRVIVHQAPDSHNPESTLSTEELTYFPKQKLATSEAAILFKRPGSVVHSQGMKAYLNDNHVQLSNAHATFEPNHG